MNKSELGRAIRNVTRKEGSFRLSSGATSLVFYDMKQLLRDPILFGEIATELSKLVPEDTQVIGGIPVGGIPLATAVFERTGIPQAIIRKEAKTSGTANRIQGEPVDGKTVTLAEDVISTGKSTLEAAGVVEEEGGQVEHVIGILIRDEKARERLQEHGITVHTLFTREELEASS